MKIAKPTALCQTLGIHNAIMSFWRSCLLGTYFLCLRLSPLFSCSFRGEHLTVLTISTSWSLYFGFTITALHCSFLGVPFRVSNPDIFCLTSAILWNCGARLHDPLGFVSYMPSKPLLHRQHCQVLLSALARAWAPWTTVASASVCWVWGNALLDSCFEEQWNPLIHFQVMFSPFTEFASLQVRACDGWNHALKAPCLLS